VASVRQDGGRAFALGNAPLRPLHPAEILQLERLGNEAQDWQQLRVAEGFDPGRVRRCCFHGEVVLGRFAGVVDLGEGVQLPAGVYNSTLAQCIVGHDALLRDLKLLANYVVGRAALVWDCGRVVCTGETAFGVGRAVSVGPESGGRKVSVYPELTVDTAAAVAGPPRQAALVQRYNAAVAQYRSRATSMRGIVGHGAWVCHTPVVENTYLGRHARVDGASLVADSTLLSDEGESTCIESGACVRHSLLQWGSRVRTQAVVEGSVLAEQALVERHGKVLQSILGPNAAVAEGEVTSSLVGPWVNSHHQSLLIATLWPEGKGNLAHGASVGCNHTSRAPDQEFLAGEGMFFGLGVSLKFPADFSQAPYTVLACGTALEPQKVSFPFSLIVPASGHFPGVSAAYNEIIPAWVLSENLFALKRNEAKFRSRDRTRRTPCDPRVFHPATIDLMRAACERLEAVRQPKDFYTDRDIPGLGKNVLLERRRPQACAAYQCHIRYYALVGLKEQIQAALEGGHPDEEDFLLAPSPNRRWEHQRSLLEASLARAGVVSALEQLLDILASVARAVEESKAKDDVRGERIIPDYALVHTRAEVEGCVQETWAEARRLQAEVQELIHLWTACRQRRADGGPRFSSPGISPANGTVPHTLVR
jgi:hypothetical protein